MFRMQACITSTRNGEKSHTKVKQIFTLVYEQGDSDCVAKVIWQFTLLLATNE